MFVLTCGHNSRCVMPTCPIMLSLPKELMHHNQPCNLTDFALFRFPLNNHIPHLLPKLPCCTPQP